MSPVPRQAVKSKPAVLVVHPANLDAESADFIAGCEKAHVTVRPAAAGMFSDLVSITLMQHRYDDKVAKCACTDLDLYLFADCGYTVCQAHGLQDIGHLRRVIAKAVRA